MTELNASIRDMQIPKRMLKLPISDQGYPIPWFVPRTLTGEPVTQAADPMKMASAMAHDLCWCCGEPLGRYKAFVIGPMCAINRIAGDPPSHRDCAEYAVKACPFLSKPRMKRNPIIPVKGGVKIPPGGVMIERNPGVVLVWICYDWNPVKDGKGGTVFQLGKPVEVHFYREGRVATRDEILTSIESGYPILKAMALREGPKAVDELSDQYQVALRLVGVAARP